MSVLRNVSPELFLQERTMLYKKENSGRTKENIAFSSTILSGFANLNLKDIHMGK